MKWSPEQAKALDSVKSWYANEPNRPFILNGYAGTGKTTLARHIAATIGGFVPFATFTGKAAHVLRRKGCETATTIHQLIYAPKHQSRARLQALEEDLQAAEVAEEHDRASQIMSAIRAEKKRLERPSFRLLEDTPLEEASAVIIDEHSMVDEKIGEDLASFGVPTIALGDPGQLPPVGGRPYFNAEPDVMLEQIHRQAADNPVIRLATMARMGERIPFGEYGASQVVPWGSVGTDQVLEHDQILVGRNKTRAASNERVRELRGFKGATPQAGERIVCLRNNHEKGIMNGSTWEVETATDFDLDTIALTIFDPDEPEDRHWVQAFDLPFTGVSVPFWERRADVFDYGYALTVHKSQGSEWPSVLVFDESGAFRQDRNKHLYTALTRASERVTLVI